MDRINTLLKGTARAFYEIEQILIMDALVLHTILPDDELAKLVGISVRDIRKACAVLFDDGMISLTVHTEVNPYTHRQSSRHFYWINFRFTVDIIKYRMLKLHKLLADRLNIELENTKYDCPRCKKEFLLLDAMGNDCNNLGEFVCDRCQTVLIHETEGDGYKKKVSHVEVFAIQTKPVLEWLRLVDEIEIPEANFGAILAKKTAGDLRRAPSTTTPTSTTVNSKPTTTKGPTSTNPPPQTPTLEVQITTEAETASLPSPPRKHTLPSWLTESTITTKKQPSETRRAGDDGAASRKEELAATRLRMKKRAAEKNQLKMVQQEVVKQDSISQYYATLAQAGSGGEGEKESDADDDDDDDDEFENFADSALLTPPISYGEPVAKRIKI